MDGIFRFSLTKGLEYVNPASSTIVGYSPEELYRTPATIVEIVHKEDFPKFKKVLEGFEKHRKQTKPLEIRLLHKDGHPVTVEMVIVPIYDDHGKLIEVEGIIRDITERKSIESILKESEARYHSIFEDSPISLWEEDFSEVKKYIEHLRHSGVHDFNEYFSDHSEEVTKCVSMVKIVDVNNATLKFYEAQDKEKIKRSLNRVLTKRAHDTLREELVAIAEGKTEFEAETTNQTLNGEERNVFLRWSAAPNCEKTLSKVFVSIIDITEHKKMEQALQKSEEMFRSVVENSHDAILIIDNNFQIIYANDECTHLGGYPKDELVGQDFRKFLDNDFKRLVVNRYLRRRNGQDVPSTYDLKIIRKDGTRREAKVKTSIVCDKQNNTRILAQVLDITNQKKIEEERKSFEKRLSALNKYGQSLNMAKTLEEVCQVTLVAMKKTLGFEYASILMVEGKKLRLICHYGYAKQFSLNLPLNGHQGITIRVVKTGRPILIPDVRKEKAYVPGRSGMQSELAVPIKSGNKILGVLNVEGKKLCAFGEEDKKLLGILASHTATALNNLRRRDQFKKLSAGLEYLMKSTTEIINARNMPQRLRVIAKAIQRSGWRRTVISLRDENMEGTDLVTAGLTKAEVRLLMQRKASGNVWRERLGPKFEKYKIGGFYYLPWNDAWIRENVHGVSPKAPLEDATTYAGVPSKLTSEEMVDWHPQDMLYAPLHTPEGKIVGILSMDDPVDGRKPTRESLGPLELFLHQAAMIIEHAQLIEGLKEAREQLETYMSHLEQKVEERTSELRKSQEQLLKAQRMAVIGELAGMVGHDLRNPLTSIAGATYYVKTRCSKMNGKIMEMLELIGKNIEYSNKIINDLLDYSREVKLDLTETDPKQIIAETLSMVTIPDNVQIKNLTQKKPRMRVDLGKLKRAFINIIKNAVDAMPRGGTLTIKAEQTDDAVQFIFSDNGVGMSKDTLNKLWTPLFTTKARGMGFGLPICKRVVEAHGGCILAQSVPRKGTTFTVTVPIESKTETGGEEIWIRPLESSSLMTTKT
jgi:PAS domain S-box-containing protein